LLDRKKEGKRDIVEKGENVYSIASMKGWVKRGHEKGEPIASRGRGAKQETAP